MKNTLVDKTTHVQMSHMVRDKSDFCQYVLADPNKSLWALNFLRDAFKADVAVAEDCVYITHDRLAFVYYKMIGGTRGFLIAFDELAGQYNLFI